MDFSFSKACEVLAGTPFAPQKGNKVEPGERPGPVPGGQIELL